MTIEIYKLIKEKIKTIPTKDLIKFVVNDLNDIKDIITHTKMILIELQVRNENETKKRK